MYKRGEMWWVQYSHRGQKHRESSESTVRKEAEALLKKRLGEAGLGTLASPHARRTTLNDLAQLVFSDYRKNGYDSINRQEDAFNHLHDFFGQNCTARKIVASGETQPGQHLCRVEDITEQHIAAYEAWREKQPNQLFTKNPKIGCARATINRELASLRRAFNLARKLNMVTRAPHIELGEEHNRRTGFFEWHDFVRVREHLPEYLKPVMTTAYYMGWRAPSELLTREKRHLVGDMLVLDFEEGKNDESRQFPLEVIPELRETINRQLEATRKLEVEQGRVIPLLFHNKGRPIVDYRPAWHKACAAAGLSGRIPHDFRRTAARNLVAAGVDPFTACQLVGWKDIEMLRRYNIIDESTLKRGVAKLRDYLDEQKQRPSKVSAIGGK